MLHSATVLLVAAILSYLLSACDQARPMPLLEVEVGKPIQKDSSEEKRARQTAEIFKSVSEAFKVDARSEGKEVLLPQYEVRVLYPERVVINVQANQSFPSLSSCQQARAGAASALGKKYGLEVTTSPLLRSGDLELSLACVLAGSEYNLHVLLRSVAETERWMSRESEKRK